MAILRLSVVMRRLSNVRGILVLAAGMGLCAGSETRAQEKTTVKFNAETSSFGNPIDNNLGEFRIYIDADFLMAIGAKETKSSIKYGVPKGSHEIKVVYTCLTTTWDRSRKVDLRENDVVDIKLIWSGQFFDEFAVQTESSSRPVTGTAVVNLEPDVFEREVASELVRTPRGTKRKVKRTRTIEYSASLTNRESTEGSASVDLLTMVNLEVRRKLEQETSRTLKQSESVEQGIEIDGALQPMMRLVWVERYRKGRAEVTLEGTKQQLEFRFPLELELRPEEVAPPQE